MGLKSNIRTVAVKAPIVRRLGNYLRRILAEADGVPMDTQAAMRAAFRQNRLIITDYAYHPNRRRLETAASGRQLVARFQQEAQAYATTLERWRAHIDALARIPRDPSVPLAPFWSNSWFPPFDAVSLYGLIAENRPGRYIEVGSGISTRFARQAIIDLGLKTHIVSIDPHPQNSIEGLCDKIIVSRLEDVPAPFWEELSENDMLFVDNSHRSFPASDVTVFFGEIMPAIPAGVVYGMHDIFLPYDYPEKFMQHFYNEQYLLMAYLLGGGGCDEIILPVCWASHRPELFDILDPLWKHDELFRGLSINGGCFWLRRGQKNVPSTIRRA